FTPYATGNYAVAVTTDHCQDTSECFRVEIPTFIKEAGLSNSLKIFPNPVDGQLTLKMKKPLTQATIRLCNLVGQTIEEWGYQEGSVFVLNMAKYAAGIYFIEICEEGKTVRRKVVKK